MKLYKVFYHDKDHGQQLRWHSNRRDAEAEIRVKLREYGKRFFSVGGPHGIEVVTFPEHKPELIKWLNTHFHTNNG